MLSEITLIRKEIFDILYGAFYEMELSMNGKTVNITITGDDYENILKMWETSVIGDIHESEVNQDESKINLYSKIFHLNLLPKDE